MEKYDIQGRETTQTCQCIQSGWLLSFHWAIRRCYRDADG
jgi:hypothetical protein